MEQENKELKSPYQTLKEFCDEMLSTYSNDMPVICRSLDLDGYGYYYPAGHYVVDDINKRNLSLPVDGKVKKFVLIG